MGLFPRKDKHIYGDYSDDIIKENFSLSDEGILPIGKRQDINRAPHALTADEVLGAEPTKPATEIPMHSAGESLYKKMMDARKVETSETDAKSDEVKKQTESLLSRCSQFVADDKGSPILTNQPAYSLDSVENIIAEAERRAQERISKLYGGEAKREEKPAETISAPAPVVETTAAEAPVAEAPAEEPKPSFEDGVSPVEGFRLPSHAAEEIPMESEEVKNYQYRFADEDRSSENDEGATIAFTALSDTPAEADQSTAVFTPVGESSSSIADGSTISFGLGDTMPVPEFDPQNDIVSSSKPAMVEEPDEEELFGDYETAADAVPIENELRSAVRKLNIRLFFTLIIAVALTIFATPFTAATREADPQTYLIATTAATALCALINIDIFKGLAAPFIKKCGSDMPVAVSTLASLAYGIFCILNQNYVLAQFGFLSAIGMFFSLFGKRSAAKRRLIGFSQIANDQDKYALTLIDEENGSYAIAHDAVEGEALVASGRRTINITRFLKNTQYSDPFSGKACVAAIITTVVAAMLAVYGFISESAVFALYLFAAFTAISAPFTAALIGTLPHKMATGRLARYGAMLTGYKAATEIEQVNAVTFDINSIFPRGRVKMYDMKVLSPNNLDETIFNAAAVTTSINSPLGHVFRRIARTSEDYVLPPADSVKYENRLGISGWVGDHSILIGNRTLMETHGVSVPSVEVDKKILRNGYFPVYVASDGRPCALLIVGYEADRDIENELRRLTRTGVVLLVNNCDPNVTEEMLCDYFGLPEDFVKIMQSGSIRMYKEQTEFRESIPAKAAFDGKATGIASIVTASIKMKKLTAIMAALHIILAFAGIAAFAALALGTLAVYLTPLNIALYLAASLITVLLAPFFYRP
ncbi:MAG: hypothetical protein IKL62_03850 [Clostridia bacterium]|nr:hypothetical protein [Clostridia bacterium]